MIRVVIVVGSNYRVQVLVFVTLIRGEHWCEQTLIHIKIQFQSDAVPPVATASTASSSPKELKSHSVSEFGHTNAISVYLLFATNCVSTQSTCFTRPLRAFKKTLDSIHTSQPK